MKENQPKAPQFTDDDRRSKVKLHPGQDGYPHRDESGKGIWCKPNPEIQCGNCGGKLEPGDKYCRICGTKKGEGAYEPYLDAPDVQVVYGPMPEERTHICPECGYSWKVCLMMDNQNYCPMCGNRVYTDPPPIYL